jgi:hypothetical protein
MCEKNSIPSKEDVQAFFDDNYDTIIIINRRIRERIGFSHI